jgi:hypothetical protein
VPLGEVHQANTGGGALGGNGADFVLHNQAVFLERHIQNQRPFAADRVVLERICHQLAQADRRQRPGVCSLRRDVADDTHGVSVSEARKQTVSLERVELLGQRHQASRSGREHVAVRITERFDI